jgi:ankyrin repeat protein
MLRFRHLLTGIAIVLLGIGTALAQTFPDAATHPTPDELANLIQGGQIDLVRSALEHGVDSNSATSTQRAWSIGKPTGAGAWIDPGTTMLNFAIDRKRLEIARLLVEHGADVNKPDSNPEALRSLQTAARVTDADFISFLLSNGALVNARDNTGYSALDHAAENDNVPVVSRLIAAGAPIDARKPPRSAPYLLERNPFYSLHGATPLIVAVAARAIHATSYLLTHHANVNATTDDGLTALLIAVAGADATATRLLLNNGADFALAAPAMHAPYNLPPVLLAQSYVADRPEYLNIVELLTSHGAHLDPKTRASNLLRRAEYNCCYVPVSH